MSSPSRATHGNGVQDAIPPLHTYASRPLASAFDRLIIVGAGGFGREVLRWATDAWPEATRLVAGFLSADPTILDGHGSPLRVIADPVEFHPRPGDGLLLAIGIPVVRRRVAEALISRGATFLTLIHPTSIVVPSATVGPGSIICPHAIVSVSARLGDCTLLNYHASVAHDASTGEFAVMSPYATLGGRAEIGDDTFLGLHASVGPGVRLGHRSKVSANSCALADVPTDSLVHGVPGRVSPLLGETG